MYMYMYNHVCVTLAFGFFDCCRCISTAPLFNAGNDDEDVRRAKFQVNMYTTAHACNSRSDYYGTAYREQSAC